MNNTNFWQQALSSEDAEKLTKLYGVGNIPLDKVVGFEVLVAILKEVFSDVNAVKLRNQRLRLTENGLAAPLRDAEESKRVIALATSQKKFIARCVENKVFPLDGDVFALLLDHCDDSSEGQRTEKYLFKNLSNQPATEQFLEKMTHSPKCRKILFKYSNLNKFSAEEIINKLLEQGITKNTDLSGNSELAGLAENTDSLRFIDNLKRYTERGEGHSDKSDLINIGRSILDRLIGSPQNVLTILANCHDSGAGLELGLLDLTRLKLGNTQDTKIILKLASSSKIHSVQRELYAMSKEFQDASLVESLCQNSHLPGRMYHDLIDDAQSIPAALGYLAANSSVPSGATKKLFSMALSSKDKNADFDMFDKLAYAVLRRDRLENRLYRSLAERYLNRGAIGDGISLENCKQLAFRCPLTRHLFDFFSSSKDTVDYVIQNEYCDELWLDDIVKDTNQRGVSLDDWIIERVCRHRSVHLETICVAAAKYGAHVVPAEGLERLRGLDKASLVELYNNKFPSEFRRYDQGSSDNLKKLFFKIARPADLELVSDGQLGDLSKVLPSVYLSHELPIDRLVDAIGSLKKLSSYVGVLDQATTKNVLEHLVSLPEIDNEVKNLVSGVSFVIDNGVYLDPQLRLEASASRFVTFIQRIELCSDLKFGQIDWPSYRNNCANSITDLRISGFLPEDYLDFAQCLTQVPDNT